MANIKVSKEKGRGLEIGDIVELPNSELGVVTSRSSQSDPDSEYFYAVNLNDLFTEGRTSQVLYQASGLTLSDRVITIHN